ncbi:MAG: hypothetical protein M1438_01705 [Deltaproteobacteria bacterium]|nr:hypothetical protein [Deltaproteobacteria bacterium]
MAATPYRTLAGQYNLSPSALCRHSKHLLRALDNQRRRRDEVHQAALLDRLDLLTTRLDRLFNSAADYHSLHVALGCIRESLRLLSLQERCRHRGPTQPS